MAFDIEAWSDYAVAVVGAAAALTGLLFVAVSVNSAWFSSSEAHRGVLVRPSCSSSSRSWGILQLVAGQSTTLLGLEIQRSVSSSDAWSSRSGAWN